MIFLLACCLGCFSLILKKYLMNKRFYSEESLSFWFLKLHQSSSGLLNQYFLLCISEIPFVLFKKETLRFPGWTSHFICLSEPRRHRNDTLSEYYNQDLWADKLITISWILMCSSGTDHCWMWNSDPASAKFKFVYRM